MSLYSVGDFLFSIVLGVAWASNDETRLVKTLFTGYNKVVRPVNHFKDPVVVTVGLQLIQLISVVGSRVTHNIASSVLRVTVINCLNTFINIHRMRSTRLSAATCDSNRFDTSLHVRSSDTIKKKKRLWTHHHIAENLNHGLIKMSKKRMGKHTTSCFQLQIINAPNVRR